MTFCLQTRPWANMDFHVVNTSSLLKLLMKTIYPFLSSRLKQHVSRTCNYYILLFYFVIIGISQPESVLQT
jgi:hypothetical protein